MLWLLLVACEIPLGDTTPDTVDTVDTHQDTGDPFYADDPFDGDEGEPGLQWFGALQTSGCAELVLERGEDLTDDPAWADALAAAHPSDALYRVVREPACGVPADPVLRALKWHGTKVIVHDVHEVDGAWEARELDTATVIDRWEFIYTWDKGGAWAVLR